ncbi:hypothetical protein INT43_008028 [Umbelopsis isabellina]|uniref:Uncharacterized protein n=1 Tax=Mortierella isabellina TaxID=91625 RepID=A0A8H7PNU9_MORIS|nr:hypothetical protein INT43_008028 [Umbelopsis isabellina]
MISSQETESSLSKKTSPPKSQKPRSPRTKSKKTSKTSVEDQHTQTKPMKKATKQSKAESPTQRKKSNNSHKKSKSSRSQSPSTEVPQLSYSSTSGTESDDSEHLDTQLTPPMYSMNLNSSPSQHTKQNQRVTIAKQEVKYAGPTFSNAPAPDMLPLPGFSNKHAEAPSQIELQRRSRDLFNLLQPQAPMNNVYTPPAQVDRPMSLQDIEQGLRTFLKIQA